MDDKPVIVVSKCLTGEKTRYDGEILTEPFVQITTRIVNFVAFCPEIEAKMGVPREPIILVKKDSGEYVAIQKETGLDWTGKIKKVSERFLSGLSRVDGFVLKAKSPSCGWNNARVFDTQGKEISKKGTGIFARQIRKHFPLIPVASDLSLAKNYKKKKFLLQVFASLWIREELKKTKSINDLARFVAAYGEILSLLDVRDFLINKLNSKKKFSILLKDYEIIIRKSFLKKIPEESLSKLCHFFLSPYEKELKLAVAKPKC